VHIDQHKGHVGRHIASSGRFSEGIVNRRHKNSACRFKTATYAVLSDTDIGSGSRGPSGKFPAAEARLSAGIENFFAVQLWLRQSILDPHSQQVVRKRGVNAEAGCRSLVRNHQVDLPLRNISPAGPA